MVEQLVGLGPLARLAADPSVTDLLVNGDGWCGSTGAAGSSARRYGCP